MRTLKMTLLLTTFLLVIPFMSNAQESTVTLEFENTETASEVVQNYVNALQNGDVPSMNSQLANNAMIYGLGGGLDSLNVSQHNKYYTDSTTEYEHSISQALYLPVKVTNNWNEGEWVLAWGTNTITNKKTGKSTIVPYHTANLVENGKITSSRYFYDMLNIIENQGFTITPPSE